MFRHSRERVYTGDHDVDHSTKHEALGTSTSASGTTTVLGATVSVRGTPCQLVTSALCRNVLVRGGGGGRGGGDYGIVTLRVSRLFEPILRSMCATVNEVERADRLTRRAQI